MSYDTIKSGIEGLVMTLGYTSTRYASFDNVPSNEIESVFTLSRLSGENSPVSETISSLIYDAQTWEIQFALQKSNENQDVNYDQLNRLVDALIKKLDAPANWESYARVQKYRNWKIEDMGKKGYWLLTMELYVEDTIIY